MTCAAENHRGATPRGGPVGFHRRCAGEEGRAIPGRVAPKHRIKQVDRFLSNDGIHVDDCCEDLTRMVIGPRKSIRIAID